MNGTYRIIKENIGMNEVIDVKDGRTSDGWFLSELIMMGYTVKKVEPLREPEAKTDEMDEMDEENAD